MRQAIEEEFILDVLGRYTDYDTYYRLVKQAAEDPEFPKRRAAAALAKFMQLHEYNLEQKTEVIVEHFPQQGAAPDGRQGEGDGGDLGSAARGALHAGVSALHRREEDTTTSGRWWLSAARCGIRTRTRSSPSRA